MEEQSRGVMGMQMHGWHQRSRFFALLRLDAIEASKPQRHRPGGDEACGLAPNSLPSELIRTLDSVPLTWLQDSASPRSSACRSTSPAPTVASVSPPSRASARFSPRPALRASTVRCRALASIAGLVQSRIAGSLAPEARALGRGPRSRARLPVADASGVPDAGRAPAAARGRSPPQSSRTTGPRQSPTRAARRVGVRRRRTRPRRTVQIICAARASRVQIAQALREGVAPPTPRAGGAPRRFGVCRRGPARGKRARRSRGQRQPADEGAFGRNQPQPGSLGARPPGARPGAGPRRARRPARIPPLERGIRERRGLVGRMPWASPRAARGRGCDRDRRGRGGRGTPRSPGTQDRCCSRSGWPRRRCATRSDAQWDPRGGAAGVRAAASELDYSGEFGDGGGGTDGSAPPPAGRGRRGRRTRRHGCSVRAAAAAGRAPQSTPGNASLGTRRRGGIYGRTRSTASCSSSAQASGWTNWRMRCPPMRPQRRRRGAGGSSPA